MIARWTSLLSLFIAAVPAAAQKPAEPIHLTIRPAAESSPALKYQLLPQARDVTPGNAAISYYRAFSPEWSYGWLHQPGMYEKVSNSLHTPLADLPRKELDWILTAKQFQEVDLAARKEYCAWDLLTRAKKEGIAFLLPDVQGFRQLAIFLAVRTRLEIADHRYDKALYTLQTSFQFARNIGEGPTFIHAVVAAAVGQISLARVEEIIQVPGSPNLYWALSGLPHPFIDLGKALSAERLIAETEVPLIRDIESARLSPQQQQELLRQLQRLAQAGDGGGNIGWESHLGMLVLAAKLYPQAKQALIDAGRTAEDVEAMPVLQVVVIYSLRQYQQQQDELFKWYNLPYWQAGPGLLQAHQQIRAAREHFAGVPFTVLLPAAIKVYSAANRLDRRIAALRCVEAIRLHAAAHQGKLPANLSEITEVPIPIDPRTGKAFEYQAEGDTATLRGPGQEGEPESSLTYLLTFKQ